MTNIVFHAFFEDSTNKDGEAGLSPTIDIRSILKSDLTNTLVVNNQAMTEIGGGLYAYGVSGADLDLNDYVAVAKTTSSAVVSKQVPALRWDAAERITLAAIAAAVWAYATRTLTTAANVIAAVLSGSKIRVHRGDTMVVPMTGLGTLANRDSLDFTVKASTKDTDDQAIIRIDEDTGLLRINGSAGTAGNGSIAVDDETAGNITITLAAVETAKLSKKGVYDVQIVRSSGVPVSTLSAGNFSVTSDVTKAVN